MMPCKRLRVQAQLAMTLDELIEAEKLRRAVTAEKEEPEKKAAAPENHSDESDSAVNAASTQRAASEEKVTAAGKAMEMQSDAPNAWQAVQPVELEEVLVDEDPQQAVQPVEFEEVLVDDDPQQVPPTSRDELSRQFLPPVAALLSRLISLQHTKRRLFRYRCSPLT